MLTSIEKDIRSSFPILQQKVNGNALVYFDNAATTQKPQEVINTLVDYYSQTNSNIHRGVHYLAQRATEQYEGARIKVQKYINAKVVQEVIFTMGTTDAINLVAQTWGRANIGEGDVILISALEHHSNMVPWQMLAEEKGASIKVIPIHEDGSLDLAVYKELLQKGVKLVAVNHISNALGTVNPVKHMISMAHEHQALVLVDGAQATPHCPIDVQDLDADFYAFSGHKVYGPTGIGVLYGKEHLLDQMPPWRGGGEMISSVSYEKSTYNDLPYKFEAGTPNIAGGIGLGSALDFVNGVGIDYIAKQEDLLLKAASESLTSIEGLRIFGTSENKAGVVSFLVDGVHPYDLGTLLDQMGVAVRTGHHCAEPLMNHFKIPGTIRASFACYNTLEEVEVFVKALKRGLNMLR